MTERIVFRVRDTVTGGRKLPDDFPTREAARHAARNLKRWRLVKVTIRSREVRS